MNLNNYTKIGAWPDAYYLSANLFSFGGAFTGPWAGSLDRVAMLGGFAGTMQCFKGLGTNDFSMLPSDLNGATVPPAGLHNFISGTPHLDYSEPIQRQKENL